MRFKTIIGTDISAEMIRQAKSRLNNIPNLKLIETDGYSLPLKDSSIDFTYSHFVFIHFKTNEMLESNFREVYRVLKPKGRFKVLVRLDVVSLERWWGGVKYDARILANIGFKIIKKETYEDWALWIWLEKQFKV